MHNQSEINWVGGSYVLSEINRNLVASEKQIDLAPGQIILSSKEKLDNDASTVEGESDLELINRPLSETPSSQPAYYYQEGNTDTIVLPVASVGNSPGLYTLQELMSRVTQTVGEEFLQSKNIVIPVVINSALGKHFVTLYYDKSKNQVVILDSRNPMQPLTSAAYYLYLKFYLIDPFIKSISLKGAGSQIVFQKLQLDDNSSGYWTLLNAIYLAGYFGNTNQNNRDEFLRYRFNTLFENVWKKEFLIEFQRICADENLLKQCLVGRRNIEGIDKDTINSLSLGELIDRINQDGFIERIKEYGRFLAKDMFGDLRDKLKPSQVIFFETIVFTCFANLDIDRRIIHIIGIDQDTDENIVSLTDEWLRSRFDFAKSIIENMLNENPYFLKGVEKNDKSNDIYLTDGIRQLDYMKIMNRILVFVLVSSVLLGLASLVLSGQVDPMLMKIGVVGAVAAASALGVLNTVKIFCSDEEIDKPLESGLNLKL